MRLETSEKGGNSFAQLSIKGRRSLWLKTCNCLEFCSCSFRVLLSKHPRVAFQQLNVYIEGVSSDLRGKTE